MITLNASGNHYHAQVEEADTQQLQRILVDYLPCVMDRFARKNRSYGENDFPLGPAAQYPEIERKVRMIKAAIWDNRETATSIDSTDETIDDLIGHLLMLKDCLYLKRAGKPKIAKPPLVEKYPEDFRGRHSYTVGELVDEPGHEYSRVIMSAHGHTIRMAMGGEERCGWRTGDPIIHDEVKRCVGIEGHESHRTMSHRPEFGDTMSVEGELDEQWHINRDLEAWPV